MKRFILFHGIRFYPSGGWKDFSESFDTQEEAVATGLALVYDNWGEWFQVVDSTTQQIVAHGYYEGEHHDKDVND